MSRLTVFPVLLSILALCCLAGLDPIVAQRPPPAPMFRRQWSAYWTTSCSYEKCSGRGYYQIDYDAKKSFIQINDVRGFPRIGHYFVLSLFDRGIQYIYTSNGCKTVKLDKMHEPNFLVTAFFEGTKSPNTLSYLLMEPTEDFKAFDNEYELHRMVINNSTIDEPVMLSYSFYGDMFTKKEYITHTFLDYESGPSSIVPQYWDVPKVCEG